MWEQTIELFRIGGWSLVAIAALSVVALALFLERLWTLRTSKIIPIDYFRTIDSLLSQRKIDEAKDLSGSNASSQARIFRAGLGQWGGGAAKVRHACEVAGLKEAQHLEQFFGILSTIVVLAPLLGFLGTVSGMIDLFSSIAKQGEVQNIGELADGIYKALYTTAAGLSVAMPAMIFHKILTTRARYWAQKMEETTEELLQKVLQ